METQNQSAEQEWIAKYRAAVNEIPTTKQRPLDKIRAALGAAWRKVVSRDRGVDKRLLNTESRTGRSSGKRPGLRRAKASEHKPAIKVFAKNPQAEKRERRTAS